MVNCADAFTRLQVVLVLVKGGLGSRVHHPIVGIRHLCIKHLCASLTPAGDPACIFWEPSKGPTYL